MANRHQRRKRAKAANLDRTIALASAHRSIEIAKLVKANMSAPKGTIETRVLKLRLKRNGSIEPIKATRRIDAHYGITSTESVLRNAGPSASASGEIAAMMRRKAYSAK